MPAAANLQTALSAANLAANEGRYADAVTRYKNLLNSYPNHPTVLHYIGLAKFHQNEYESAIDYIRKAIAASSQFDGEMWKNLGVCYARQGNHDQARACWSEILQQDHNNADARLLIAKSHATQLDFSNAKIQCEKNLQIQPRHVDTNILMATLERTTSPENTIKHLKVVISEQPNNMLALGLLQDTYARLLLIKESNETLKKILSIDENFSNVYSTYLMMLHYEDEIDPHHMVEQHKQWANRFKNRSHINAITVPNPEKKIRIGVVSGDFLFHPVMTFFFTIIDSHDSSQFGYYLYSETINPDTMTRDLRRRAERWRDVRGLEDDAIAKLIVSDKIDILIDISGHTAHNRLGVFALRPAPLQLTYIGYPDTTGLSEIDYKITDAIADPPGKTDQYYTEKLIRLPDTFLCYHGTIEAPLAELPPSEKIGHIAFGCFNNYLKLSDRCLRLFSEVLNAVPDSVLVLKSSHIKNDNSNEIILSRLKSLGVDSKRILFFKHIPSKGQHLSFYNSIDIALDSYPYNGTTTTCEAFYMGVPVISRVGATHYARVGASLLHAVGLRDLAAEDDEAFIRAAKTLALDRARLKLIKTTLRQTLRSSPLGDPKIFVPTLENCLRSLWREWCYEHQDSTPTIQTSDEKDPELLNTPEYIVLKIPNNVSISLPNSIDNYSTFVILEQEDWYEEEIQFVRAWSKSGMYAADIGADHGTYTLSIAQALGNAGRIFTFESNSQENQLLAKSIAINGYTNVILSEQLPGVGDIAQLPKSVESDDILDLANKSRFDFIRIGTTYDLDSVVSAIGAILDASSPIVMVNRKIDHPFDSRIFTALTTRGYSCFKYVAALKLLAPYDTTEETDYFTLNLFFCKKNRALDLSRNGMLVVDRLNQPYFKQSSQAGWQGLLAALPYAANLIATWKARAVNKPAPFWDDYERNLDLATGALFSLEIPPDERLWRLETAFIGLSQGINRYANIPRMLTCIRVAMSIGRRELALKLTSKAFQILSQNVEVQLNEPFLPALSRYDNIEMSQSQEKWVRACVTESLERYGYFTAYTAGCMPLSKLDYLPILGIITPDLERRKTLIHFKEGLIDKIIPSVTFKTSGEFNLNLEFWKNVADGKINIGRGNILEKYGGDQRT